MHKNLGHELAFPEPKYGSDVIGEKGHTSMCGTKRSQLTFMHNIDKLKITPYLMDKSISKD